MKKLLFVDACPRGSESRSRRLALSFLQALQQTLPDISVQTLCVKDLNLKPLDADGAAYRDRLIKEGDLKHPDLELACQFAEADAVVIAAPFWDMSFPGMLRLYLERIFVVGLTFHYDENGNAVGDCKPARMIYVTTRGGYVTEKTPDFAVPYLQATCSTLGIEQFDSLAANGLDIIGNDAEALLRKAEADATNLAATFENAHFS